MNVFINIVQISGVPPFQLTIGFNFSVLSVTMYPALITYLQSQLYPTQNIKINS